jgi:hypothetical protein
MRLQPVAPPDPIPLPQQVEDLILRRSFGRIRDLAVEEVQDRIVVRGWVPSQYLKQLVLLAALEVLPSHRLDAEITVR